MLSHTAGFPSFKRRNSVPLCLYTFSLSVIGCLGCFHSLTIVTNAAINMEVQISFQDPNFNFFCVCVCPEVGLLDHEEMLLIF